jgi:tetratricopeptide (TPR) repeat protein
MNPRSFCRATGLALVLAATFVRTPAAGQAAPADATREQLNRIGADLFSPTPHAPQAIDQLKAILAADPELADAHMLLGIAYRLQGAPELMGESVAEFRQALALNPKLTLARLALARVYLDMARASRAREELEIARGDIGDQPPILSLLGETERQLGRPQRSVELNRQILAADPDFVQARYYLGLALIDLRQHAAAVRELEAVVKSGANPAESHAGLGTAYLAAGRPRDAVAALREAVRLNPARAELHLRLSRAYRESGRVEAAVKELALARPALGGAAAQYQDLETDYYLEEGLVRLQQGRLEAAAQSFQRVLDIDAAHEPARRALTEVRKRLEGSGRIKKP